MKKRQDSIGKDPKPKNSQPPRRLVQDTTIQMTAQELREIEELHDLLGRKQPEAGIGANQPEPLTQIVNLRELREIFSKTQAEVAESGEWTQGQLSQIETRKDHRLSTLRRYIKALGGQLIVVARFGDKKLNLSEI